MGSLTAFVQTLNKNKIFKFFSSVKLAVPLMLTLSAVVGYGTVLESKYNAEYSGMAMYKTEWFSAILILLWLNIFCATISRIPFKKHHTGFVITHIGLLTMLIGGFLTNSYGVDGQLSVAEGQSSSTVVLPDLMIGYQLEGSPTPMTVKLKKSIFAKSETQLSSINENLSVLFKVVEYIPFAKVEKVYKQSNTQNDEVALSFILKSNFFNVNEWLHTKNNPEMKLGPATLRIVKVASLDEVEPIKKNKIPKAEPKRVINAEVTAKDTLVVLDFSSGKTIKTIDVKQLQKNAVSINGVKIVLTKQYRAAVVSANKLEENLDPNATNPALELNVEKDGKSLREVLYGKFDQFSLNKEGVFGLKFVFKSSGVAPIETATQAGAHQGLPAGHVKIPDKKEEIKEQKIETHAAEPMSAAAEDMQPPSMADMGSRVIEFKVNPQDPKRVKISLYKKGEFVQSEILNEGQNFQTPWMGMKIFLGTVQVGAQETSEVVPVSPEKRSQLPPSAAKIRTSDGDEFWLTEGEQKSVTSGNKNFVVYFGREFVDLPFDINLQKFTKMDYPGTSTAMSYESLVSIGKSGVEKLISMNEPLKQSGFTIYQASYIMNPGETPVSVFSVNQDPGRAIKYLGSLILALGVIIYTFMKSSIYRKMQKGKA